MSSSALVSVGEPHVAVKPFVPLTARDVSATTFATAESLANVMVATKVFPWPTNVRLVVSFVVVAVPAGNSQLTTNSAPLPPSLTPHWAWPVSLPS